MLNILCWYDKGSWAAIIISGVNTDLSAFSKRERTIF